MSRMEMINKKFIPQEIEYGILPLVEAMNKLPYLRTTESCTAHPSQQAYQWFWTRGAFVSFEIENEKEWKKVLRAFIKWSKQYGGYVFIQKHFKLVGEELKSWWLLIIQPTRNNLSEEEYREYFDERIHAAIDFFKKQSKPLYITTLEGA